MEAVVREEDTTQASPMGKVPVDKNVGPDTRLQF